ncbi:MAG: sirohydrochlorin cobaltochelatase [Clostridiales bacterium]|nr:sirohydrochlorin cobaltochelatase [Candidatus Blautia equi]
MNTAENSRKAILVVSFGTSYETTRKVTIEAIEEEIAAAYPAYTVYRAWTSKMIIAKLKKRSLLSVDNVEEAMERMISDGVQELIVQPTHVTNGIENDAMKEDILKYKASFSSISICDPLLTSEEDKTALLQAVNEEFADLPDDTALVFMGHGTPHYANSIYAAMDYTFKDQGKGNIFMGTVEAYPDFDAVLRNVKKTGLQKVLLAPFMIVAGDHANNDLAGDDEDSWKSRFEKEGFQVSARLKGLGEYAKVRELFVKHIETGIK